MIYRKCCKYLCLAFAILLVCNCRKEGLRTVTYDDVYEYGESSYSFRINLVEAYGGRHFADNVNADIENWLFSRSGLKLTEARDEYVNEQIEKFRACCDDNLKYATGNGVTPHSIDYEMTIDMQPASQCAAGVIGINVELYCYTGGAHGNRLVTCRNYSDKDGGLISLDEIFDDGYQEPLEHLLETKLLVSAGCGSLEELGEAGYYPGADVFIPDNFRLRADDIVFIYNQYDIAPYSTGVTELSVTYREMKKAGIRYSGMTWK